MNTESRSKNSIKNATSEVLVRLMIAGSKFLLRTVFIYTLGIQYNGIAGLFNDILFVFSLAELGIHRAISFALYKPLALNDEDTVARIMKFYKRVYRIIALVIFLAGLCLIPFLKFLVKGVDDVTEPIWLIFILFVIQSASSYLFIYKATLLEANQQKRLVSYINIVANIIQVICESIILIVFKEYLLYLLFSITSTILKNVVISYVAQRQFPILKKKVVGPLTKEEKKQISSDIGATAIYNVSDVIVHTTDTIVTAAFFPTTIVGILSNYRLIINTINTMISQVSASTVPSIGNLAVSATKEKMKELHGNISFLMFIIGNFVCASLMTLMNPFIEDIWLNDSRYLFIMPTVIVILFNLYLCIMQYPNTAFRNSNGLFVQGRLRPAIMAVLNIVFSIALAVLFSRSSADLPDAAQWGVFGILLATPLARVFTETWFDPYIVHKYVFELPMKKYILTRLFYFLIACASCTATYFGAQWIIDMLSVSNVYVGFLLRILCALVIPNAILLIIFAHTKVFKESVSMVLGAVLKKRNKL